MINSLYYLIPVALLLAAAFYIYRSIEREMMYFRFSCENIFDIDYLDYVNNYKFFDVFNNRLSEHLRLYAQDRFRALGVPHKDLQLCAEVEYETITISCYLEMNTHRHKRIQEEIVRSINLDAETRKFYAFCAEMRNPEYQPLFRLKEKREEKTELNKKES